MAGNQSNTFWVAFISVISITLVLGTAFLSSSFIGDSGLTAGVLIDGGGGGGGGSVTTYSLAVYKSGTGTGTVTSSPAGISCGYTCSYSFKSGTAVTLTAIPTAGHTFTGWTGGCSGTATTCTLTMYSAKSATATFKAPATTLKPTTYTKYQAAQYTTSITLNWDIAQSNVNKIDFNGIPGGELCGAAIRLTAYDALGIAIGSKDSGRVNTHTSASSTLTFNSVKTVKKVVGTLVGDGAAWTNDCTNIDELRATLYITDDRTGPETTVAAANNVDRVPSGDFGTCYTKSYTISALTSDPSGISKVDFYVNTVKYDPTCVQTATGYSCSKTLYDIKTSQQTKNIVVDSFDYAYYTKTSMTKSFIVTQTAFPC